jgi:hypothetical protein
MFTVNRILTSEETAWVREYYQDLHGEAFAIPPDELNTARDFLCHFNILRRATGGKKTHPHSVPSSIAFGRRQLEILETGHFILSSIADVIGTEPLPAFLVGLCSTDYSPLLICALIKPSKPKNEGDDYIIKNNKHVLALASFNHHSARFASPLWTPATCPIPEVPTPLPPPLLVKSKSKGWWCRLLRT